MAVIHIENGCDQPIFGTTEPCGRSGEARCKRCNKIACEGHLQDKAYVTIKDDRWPDGLDVIICEECVSDDELEDM